MDGIYITCPANNKGRNKEDRKVDWYKMLASQIKYFWSLKKVMAKLAIVETQGKVTKNIAVYMEKIGIAIRLLSRNFAGGSLQTISVCSVSLRYMTILDFASIYSLLLVTIYVIFMTIFL